MLAHFDISMHDTLLNPTRNFDSSEGLQQHLSERCSSVLVFSDCKLKQLAGRKAPTYSASPLKKNYLNHMFTSIICPFLNASVNTDVLAPVLIMILIYHHAH
jgi:hypothetical protein